MVFHDSLVPLRGRAIKPALESAPTGDAPSWPCQPAPRASQPTDERQNQPDNQRGKGNPRSLRYCAAHRARTSPSAQQSCEVTADKAKGISRPENDYYKECYQRQCPGQPSIQQRRACAANTCGAGRHPATQEVGNYAGQD